MALCSSPLPRCRLQSPISCFRFQILYTKEPRRHTAALEYRKNPDCAVTLFLFLRPALVAAVDGGDAEFVAFLDEEGGVDADARLEGDGLGGAGGGIALDGFRGLGDGEF